MAKGNDMSERNIIKMMRDEYHHRLTEAISESDVFDGRDNMVIGQDLKVRHKKSQYEYTVDDVIDDPATDEVQITLRLPDEPRFEPPPENEDVVITDRIEKGVLGEDELANLEPDARPGLEITDELYDDSGEEVFVIDREEFEKEYEVK